MRFLVSTRVRIHRSAATRFAQWAAAHAAEYASLRAALESAQGTPVGAVQLVNKRWLWAVGATFVSYILKDEPLVALGGTVTMPFLVERHVIITDIVAL